jgi:hypothetical protein
MSNDDLVESPENAPCQLQDPLSVSQSGAKKFTSANVRRMVTDDWNGYDPQCVLIALSRYSSTETRNIPGSRKAGPRTEIHTYSIPKSYIERKLKWPEGLTEKQQITVYEVWHFATVEVRTVVLILAKGIENAKIQNESAISNATTVDEMARLIHLVMWSGSLPKITSIIIIKKKYT